MCLDLKNPNGKITFTLEKTIVKLLGLRTYYFGNKGKLSEPMFVEKYLILQT